MDHIAAASDAAHPNARLSLDSTLIENCLELQLLGQITAALLVRGYRYELLHSSCDRDGYDVVLDVNGFLRHIQLKGVVEGGRRAEFTLHTRLAEKPSACAIAIVWEADTLRPTSYRFFGGEPGQPIPDLGDRPARHSRGNSLGLKGVRPDHRVIPLRRFDPIADLETLLDRLFGIDAAEAGRL